MTQTILWQDGFDWPNISSDLTMKYATQGCNFSTTGGRFGGGAPSNPSSSVGLNCAFGSTQTNLWASFAVNLTSTSSNSDRPVLQMYEGSTLQLSVTYDPATAVWKIVYNLGFISGNSTSYGISSGWHWIDVNYVSSNSGAGSVQLWVDGNQILAPTSQNTSTTGNGISNVIIGDQQSGNSCPINFDDLFIYTGTVLGDSRIETPLPNSDAGPNQATPSTGTNHYACVNEAQWDTSPYLTMANTSGNKEVFGHTAISSTPATVIAVQVLLISEKSDAGAYALKPLVVSSGVEADGGSANLLTSFAVQTALFQNDPNTGSPWTYANANAANIGFKVP